MVVGGFPAYFFVEIVDISGQNLTCPALPNYPIEYGMVGTYINDKALVCGGHDNGADFYGDCYSYNELSSPVSN